MSANRHEKKHDWLETLQSAAHRGDALRRAAAFLKINNDPLYRYRRLTQIFFGAEALIVMVILANLASPEDGRSMVGTLLYLSLLVVILALHATFQIGAEKWALRITLWTSMVTVTLVPWMDMGLRDQAFTGYGIVLAISATLESRFQFRVKVATVLLNAIAMGIANSMGWMRPLYPFGWADVSDLVLIYALMSYCIGALSGDLQQMVERYREEVQKVEAREAEIIRLVHHDALTGLPNRIILQREFEQIMDTRRKLSLLYIDLDHFKAVNDNHGHPAGDQLLLSVAATIKSVIPPGAMLARIGGDEFLLLVPEDDPHAIATLATSLRAAVSAPVEIGLTKLLPAISMGIAMAPTHGEDFDTLHRKADIALYAAKAAGRNGFRIYDEAMNATSLSHLSLVAKLRDALIQNEFQLVYLPKMRLDTGEIDGVEALLRWQPRGGPVMLPDDFIPLAEHYGLMTEIGRWVLNEACQQCRNWQLEGHENLRVSVNLSPSQLRGNTLEPIIRQALEEADLAPQSLELELREATLSEGGEDVFTQLGRLSRLGVRLAIGDFGQGYSNLANKGMLKINTVKIGRRFVTNMEQGSSDRALVEALVHMAKSLDLAVVAEGVESRTVEDEVRDLGFSAAQGFRWSLPLHPGDFTEFVASGRDPRRAINIMTW